MSGRLLAALLAASLLAIPAATAQASLPPALGYRFDAIPPAPIKPVVESATFLAVATVRCDVALQPGGTAVVFTFESSGVTVTGPASVIVDPDACPSAEATATVQQAYQITIPRTTPGLTPIAVTGKARLEPPPSDPTSPPPDEAGQTFTVTADYFSDSQLTMERKLIQCNPCRHVPVEVELTNLGNARTAYTFEVATKPSHGWDLELPEPVVVEAQDSAKAILEVKGGGGEGAFQVVVHPAAADDPMREGDPLTAHFLVRDTSIGSRLSPGPASALLLLGLAGLALSRRRA